jgi:outer membrane protein OmpA-like peptidoglycan-associated protein
MHRLLWSLLFALFAVAPLSALAQSMDCPPVGHLPNYVAEEAPTLRDYQSDSFDINTPADADAINVAGRYCHAYYKLPEGATPMSPLEVHSNYRQQFAKLGAQSLYLGNSYTYVKLNKDGKEFWIKVYGGDGAIEVTVIEKQAPKQTLLPPSGTDYRLLGHLPNYIAGEPKTRNFDQAEFTADTSSGESKSVTVAGKAFALGYTLKDGAPALSDLEIQTNYRNRLKELGALLMHTEPRYTYANLEQNGQNIWLSVYSSESSVEINVVEEKPFQASIEPPKEDALKAALDKDGHVALYINFDFAKATLKPDAQPVIAQVQALLKDNPALKLSIDGHTDNIGSDDYNQKLSTQRAATVVETLAKSGIAADRLKSAGFGASKPTADNTTSEGRGKNRRVELVKI